MFRSIICLVLAMVSAAAVSSDFKVKFSLPPELKSLGIDASDFNELKTSLQSIINMEPMLQNSEMTTSVEELESFGMKVDLLETKASCRRFSDILTTSTSYFSTCGNAVDYQFYLPANTSLAFLEKTARSILNNTALTLLPTSCQVSLKKLVCSNIYLKCYPGADPTDTTNKAGWNNRIYSDVNAIVANQVKLPFERPCRSVCVNTNKNCLGVLGLLGLTQNCDGTYDYSGGKFTLATPKKYDLTNDTNYCNGMTKSFQIGSSKEVYNGTFCTGIVDNLYVFPASQISKSFAPMQPPYVVQSKIESLLRASFADLPVFLSEDCHFALKKYFCRSSLPNVYEMTFGDAFAKAVVPLTTLGLLLGSQANARALNVTKVYLPSFPSNDVCESYSETCAAFIKLAGKDDLEPSCDATATFGSNIVKKYPNTTQVLASLSFTAAGTTKTLKFSSPPDDVSTATASDGYSTACPEGFVVPDVPDDDRIRWVDGTGCAVACRVPTLTNGEYNTMDQVMHYLAAAGIAGTFIVFMIYVTDEKKRQEQQTIIIFAVFACINAISFTILRATPDAKTCSNNAVGMDHEDPASICTVTAFVNMFCIFACTVAWMLHSVDIFLKIVLGLKTAFLRELNIVLILSYPLICLIGAGTLELYGYSSGPKLCIFSGNNPHDFNTIAVFIIPLCFIVAVAAICKAIVVFVVTFYPYSRKDVSMRVSKRNISSRDTEPGVELVPGTNTESNEEGKGNNDSESKPQDGKRTLTELVYDINDITHDHSIYDLITSVTFNQVFFALWVISLVFRVRNYHLYYKQENSFYKWAECAFQNFNGVNQDWHEECGFHPAYRQPFGLQLTYYAFIGGQGILFSVIFLLNPALWYELYQKFTGSTKKDDEYEKVPLPPEERVKYMKRRQTANVTFGENGVFEDQESDEKPNYMDNSSFHGNQHPAPEILEEEDDEGKATPAGGELVASEEPEEAV